MSKKIMNARKTMRDAFKNDADFRDLYKANIAMTIYDKRVNGKLNHAQCNEVAEDLIDLLFAE
jgi:hypothetical protein